MTNLLLSKHLIESLVQNGVQEFILCAGARNSPLLYLLENTKSLKTYHFFEERSAAFFALGRIAEQKNPLAVITTSGTAAAELLPAAVEGFYSGLPLIMVTADRPKTYRGSGAPQSIEQVGLFSHYIEASFDLDKQDHSLDLKNLSWQKPVHINVCFEEPLIDGPTPEISEQFISNTAVARPSLPEDLLQIKNFLSKHKPVVIVGPLPAAEKNIALSFLKKFQGLIYLEALSGLQNHPELHDKNLVHFDKIIFEVFKNQLCDAVFRIGGVPTLRFWRDLEESMKSIPVLSISANSFTGLSRPSLHFDQLNLLTELSSEKLTFPATELSSANVIEKNQQMLLKLNELFQKFPKSEPALVHSISKLCHEQSVYLGNSLPIREWDLAADHQVHPLRVFGNRGANGIDGQLSTFLGWGNGEAANWAVLGDLTALYDLSALWVTDQLPSAQWRIVIINNQGGQIFKRMFKKDIFLNTHQIQFQPWAQMWGWDYILTSSVDSLDKNHFSDRQIIEVHPDAEQTQQFWDQWEQAWV